MSVGKRAAVIGAILASMATAAPVALADAPGANANVIQPAGPVAGAYQAGIVAAVGGWNAGADAAVGGLNAGGAALGVPFQLTLQTAGPLGLHVLAWPPLVPTP